MNKCIILETGRKDYSKVILFLSDESILACLLAIRQKLLKENFNGKILLDQLFTTGNSKNRFISIQFINGKYSIDSLTNVNPPEYFHKKTIDFLRDNYYYVENSILTGKQREMIKAGKVF